MKHVLELDYETTGLDPLRHCLIEVGARVFVPGSPEKPVAEFHDLVKPDIDAAAAADEYALNMHRESKLFERALDHPLGKKDVERNILKWIEPFEGPLVLGGNTSHFDRGFMARHMPELDKKLSHRHADVSGMRMCIWWITGEDPMVGFEKVRAHTSLADLDETQKELDYYRRKLGL